MKNTKKSTAKAVKSTTITKKVAKATLTQVKQEKPKASSKAKSAKPQCKVFLSKKDSTALKNSKALYALNMPNGETIQAKAVKLSFTPKAKTIAYVIVATGNAKKCSFKEGEIALFFEKTGDVIKTTEVVDAKSCYSSFAVRRA